MSKHKKLLEINNEIYEVVDLFSHHKREYITINVKDTNGNPYVICDSKDIYYHKLKNNK